MHDESLATHGGGTGIRDEGLLDSALARPLNLMAYANASDLPDIASLAAAYCIRLAKNYPLVDGNKRAAFLATGLFLYLNGYRLTATQADATLTIFSVAASDLSEADFARLLGLNIRARQT